MAGIKHVASMVEDLLCMDLGAKEIPARERQKWMKPDPGWYKVNTDAAFKATSSTGSGGAVTRDADGALMGKGAFVSGANTG